MNKIVYQHTSTIQNMSLDVSGQCFSSVQAQTFDAIRNDPGPLRHLMNSWEVHMIHGCQC